MKSNRRLLTVAWLDHSSWALAKLQQSLDQATRTQLTLSRDCRPQKQGSNQIQIDEPCTKNLSMYDQKDTKISNITTMKVYYTCSPSTPKILGNEGPHKSTSKTPTLKFSEAKHLDNMEVTVDFPEQMK